MELHGFFTKYTGGSSTSSINVPSTYLMRYESKKRGNPSKSRGRMWLKPNTVKVILTAISGGNMWKPPWLKLFFYFLAIRPMGKPHFQPTSWRHCPRHVGKKWPHRPMFHYRIGINNIKRINTYQKLFKHCLQSTWYKTCSLQPGRLPGVDVPPSWFWSLMKINLMLLPHSTYWS